MTRVYVSLCTADIHNTHRTVLIISPLILQPIIIAEMLSIEWHGASFSNSLHLSPNAHLKSSKIYF